MKRPADWITPQWPVPPNVEAFITTRIGGVSRGPYATFNIGLHTGDEVEAVHENRAILRRFLPEEPKWLAQKHGTMVVDADDIENVPDADGAVARRPGTVCAIMVADCVPVLFADRAGTVVAAAHAGWRGLASGVLQNTIRRMRVAPRDVLAYLGPGIGPTAFEVGGDVREAFISQDEAAGEAFAALREGKWLADLYSLARRAMSSVGVTAVYGGEHCTVSEPARFYSYRRDRTTGRMAALIWRTG